MFKKLTVFGMSALLVLGLAACGSNDKGSSKGGNGAATVGESVDHKIIGIDPGAGLMKATAKAIDEYELDDWTLVEGSGAAMTAALKKAYDNEEPIIVTGWSPHWKFAKFDLKYLEDPKGIYGTEESIHTVVRDGLKDDEPNAYKLLDQFHWDEEDMNTVMVAIQDGLKPEEAAEKWIEDNQDKVNAWKDGVETVDGNSIHLAYVAWDTEIASTNVVAKVLEDIGYDVKLSQVEAGPMFTGVADGSVDATVAVWLPVTHEDYMTKYEGKLDDLGPNLEGTRIGLVVPTYMDINSIEDLKK